jgi:hypothetical protein
VYFLSGLASLALSVALDRQRVIEEYNWHGTMGAIAVAAGHSVFPIALLAGIVLLWLGMRLRKKAFIVTTYRDATPEDIAALTLTPPASISAPSEA